MNRNTIVITTKALKKGKPDICSFDAQVVELHGQFIFVLDGVTNRSLYRDYSRFKPEPGCAVKFEDHTLLCTDVSYTSAPKHPIITASLVA